MRPAVRNFSDDAAFVAWNDARSAASDDVPFELRSRRGASTEAPAPEVRQRGPMPPGGASERIHELRRYALASSDDRLVSALDRAETWLHGLNASWPSAAAAAWIDPAVSIEDGCASIEWPGADRSLTVEVPTDGAIRYVRGHATGPLAYSLSEGEVRDVAELADLVRWCVTE